MFVECSPLLALPRERSSVPCVGMLQLKIPGDILWFTSITQRVNMAYLMSEFSTVCVSEICFRNVCHSDMMEEFFTTYVDQI